MDKIEIIETKMQLEADNDNIAQEIRNDLTKKKVFLINLMAGPGSGKTTTLVRTINSLKHKYRFGVMEADMDSDVDAKTISETGAKVIQIHTLGSCHMDASMTIDGLNTLGVDDLDVVFIENIGNLVCPAEFDTGAHKKVTILSIPEGDDKPLKYPLIFKVSDVILFNKIDVKEVFDFDEDVCKERILKLNDKMEFFSLSSLNGDGFDKWIDWLDKEIMSWKEANV